MPLPAPGATDRTRLRRLPELAVEDRTRLNEVLDAGLVAHVALVHENQPYTLPVAYARTGDSVVLHGSTGSRLFRQLATAVPICASVTLVDGLVLARSLFESSMNYRSVMVLGCCTALEGAEKLAALEQLSEHLLPGRWAEARQPTSKELAATLLLTMPLTECSVKISEGGPDDPEEDLDWPAWAGVVPIQHAWGTPIPADDLRPGLPVPSYVDRWPAGRT